MRRVVTAGLGVVYSLGNSAIAMADQASEPQKTRLQDLDVVAILVNWFPMLLLIGVWVFFMRSMKGGVRANDVQKRYMQWMDKTEKLLEELVQIQKQK